MNLHFVKSTTNQNAFFISQYKFHTFINIALSFTLLILKIFLIAILWIVDEIHNNRQVTISKKKISSSKHFDILTASDSIRFEIRNDRIIKWEHFISYLIFKRKTGIVKIFISQLLMNYITDRE